MENAKIRRKGWCLKKEKLTYFKSFIFLSKFNEDEGGFKMKKRITKGLAILIGFSMMLGMLACGTKEQAPT